MMLRSTLILMASLSTALAWTTSSRVSSFGGSVLVTGRPSDVRYNNAVDVATKGDLEMKKGKANVPANMRTQYKRQMEMAQMQKQMLKAQQAGEDGLPVFNLFVRTKRANMWYPCGSFKGDDRSAALCKSFVDGGLLAGISKKQLDGGISGSLYQDQDKLKDSICRTYPQLRKSRDDFEFGYRLSFPGLDDEQAKEIKVIEPKEQKGLVDNIKNIFSS